MRKSNRKLSLSRETLVNLTPGELKGAGGGFSIPTAGCSPTTIFKATEKLIEKGVETHLPNLPSGDVAKKATYACC